MATFKIILAKKVDAFVLINAMTITYIRNKNRCVRMKVAASKFEKKKWGDIRLSHVYNTVNRYY